MSMIKCSGAGRCQTASKTDCTCECGGVYHGARGRLAWAASLAKRESDRTIEERKHVTDASRRQAKAKSALEDCLKPKKQRLRRGTGFYCQDADRAAEFTRTVDVIGWLVAHQGDQRELERLVDLLDATLESLGENYGTHTRDLHRRTADHLWCDVIAALVIALEELASLQDTVTEALTDATLESVKANVLRLVEASRSRPGEQRPRGAFRERISRAQLDTGLHVTKELLEPAVSAFVGDALQALGWTVSPLPLVLLKLRLLAVLLCPDPSRHKAVWDHCLIPLFDDLFASPPLVKLLQERTALLSEMDWGGRRPAPRRPAGSRH